MNLWASKSLLDEIIRAFSITSLWGLHSLLHVSIKELRDVGLHTCYASDSCIRQRILFLSICDYHLYIPVGDTHHKYIFSKITPNPCLQFRLFLKLLMVLFHLHADFWWSSPATQSWNWLCQAPAHRLKATLLYLSSRVFSDVGFTSTTLKLGNEEKDRRREGRRRQGSKYNSFPKTHVNIIVDISSPVLC